ncbi:hypothetical protein EGW08_018150 [Elysia chlorotica]|uniref:Uncharacterized protein n=1 Tax=Elysia chlorotica TaxID=188477 RepID=A0A3S1B1W5_ELYCH|nr:hypothetical protein EGW08_018150 [Elysia chlorotica]
MQAEPAAPGLESGDLNDPFSLVTSMTPQSGDLNDPLSLVTSMTLRLVTLLTSYPVTSLIPLPSDLTDILRCAVYVDLKEGTGQREGRGPGLSLCIVWLPGARLASASRAGRDEGLASKTLALSRDKPRRVEELAPAVLVVQVLPLTDTACPNCFTAKTSGWVGARLIWQAEVEAKNESDLYVTGFEFSTWSVYRAFHLTRFSIIYDSLKFPAIYDPLKFPVIYDPLKFSIIYDSLKFSIIYGSLKFPVIYDSLKFSIIYDSLKFSVIYDSLKFSIIYDSLKFSIIYDSLKFSIIYDSLKFSVTYDLLRLTFISTTPLG